MGPLNKVQEHHREKWNKRMYSYVYCTDSKVGYRCDPCTGIHDKGCRYAKSEDKVQANDRQPVLVDYKTAYGNRRFTLEDLTRIQEASEADAEVDGEAWVDEIQTCDLGDRYRSSALASVLNERVRQDVKWGEQNHHPDRWMRIIMEELGEFCYEVDCGNTFMRDEAVQVAAVALAMVECLDRGKWCEGKADKG